MQGERGAEWARAAAEAAVAAAAADWGRAVLGVELAAAGWGGLVAVA